MHDILDPKSKKVLRRQNYGTEENFIAGIFKFLIKTAVISAIMVALFYFLLGSDAF